ncbi:MAG: leucine-rich repeat protein, partial [Ruminococcus sp.]|nr:leucine-rich repeat protein [Ruminococcus sp.]
MKKKSRIIASVLALTLAVNGAMYSNGVFDKGVKTPSYLTASAVTSADIYSVVTEGNNSSNAVSANSTTWASPDKTYLGSNADGTLSRITVNSSTFTVDTYNADYSYASGVDIDFELPVWGGYYCGSQYNFCLFGQQNPDENDSVEVMRVVKYSKDWERIDSFSTFGSNTRTPFFAGSPDMHEENGRLYIHASHEMYATEDGYNHQSNYQLHLDIETMESVFLFDDISYIERGYVSHSFDQYVRAEGDYVYTVDHGDAYPRSVVICKKHYNGSMIDHTEPYPIYGTVGDNTTGVSLGGFELTKNKCIVAGNSIPQDGTATSTAQRNIFVTITDKEFSTSEIIYLTEFEDTFRVSKPKLVKLDDTTFIVMWNEYNDDGEIMHAVKMDENGNILEDITTGALVSACDPILVGEEMVWPVSDGSRTVFYHLDYSDLTAYDGIEGAGEQTSTEPTTEGTTLDPTQVYYTFLSYGDYATVYECQTGASKIEIPEEVQSIPIKGIENYAFYDCTTITDVELHSGIEKIGYGVFIGCTSLETVTIKNP